MSFAQLKSAIKSRFMDDSNTIKDQPSPTTMLRSSATCPNFSFGDAASLPSSTSTSVSTTSTATSRKTSSASAGDWGNREHYLKLAFLSDTNNY